MSWSDFIGNGAGVAELRRFVAAGHRQATLVLAGPEGIGKTTLAWMLGLALNCRAPQVPGEFCGDCASCRQAQPVDQLDARVAEALETRAAEVKTNPRETAPLKLALHPAVRIYPPDGDMFSLPQARTVIHQSQLRPDAGTAWTLILPDFDRARWATQAAMLKTLEEPPAGVVLVVLARNPMALLPTVRSRSQVLVLRPVADAELAHALAASGRQPAEADLLARLAHGRPGRALQLDLAAYRRLRHDALSLLSGSPGSLAADRAHSALSVIRLSESTRADKEKFEPLTEILYSVLQDIVYLQSGFPEAVRNLDCVPELERLAERGTMMGTVAAVEALGRVQAAARRNAFRPLGLASWALQSHGEEV